MSEFDIARRRMVDGQIRASDVTNIDVIEAMLAVPREVFVPAQLRATAYLDTDIEVGGTTGRRSYLIKPMVCARMLQAAEILPTDRTLVVGCATGYLAALAARLCGRVTATEIDNGAVDAARKIFAELGIDNIDIHGAPASDGFPANGPYEVIVLDGATEIDPAGLLRQLTDGGRLVGVFAKTRPSRAMVVTHSQNDFGTRALFDATVPTLAGLESPPTFVF